MRAVSDYRADVLTILGEFLNNREDVAVTNW